MSAFEPIARGFRKNQEPGMGGFGSGRTSGSGRSLVEFCRAIDVHTLQRAGCLRPGWMGGWQWLEDGKQVAWIGLRAGPDRLRLSYKVRIAGGEWQDVEEDVSITHVPCRFGGTRAYMICPGIVNGIVCGRRVVKLYGAGRYFLCRHCSRLAYASQGEDALDRSHRRAHKVRRRLGGDAGMFAAFPQKPKGMWTRTFDRLRAHALKAEIRTDMLFESKAARLMARLKHLDDKESFL